MGTVEWNQMGTLGCPGGTCVALHGRARRNSVARVQQVQAGRWMGPSSILIPITSFFNDEIAVLSIPIGERSIHADGAGSSIIATQICRLHQQLCFFSFFTPHSCTCPFRHSSSPSVGPLVGST